MDQGNAPLSIVATIARILIFFIGLYLLYVIYNWLFNSSTTTSYKLIDGVMIANNVGTPPTIAKKDAPFLVPGGSFSVSGWVYVSDFHGANNNQRKNILSILNPDGSVALVAYLGMFTNTLHVRAFRPDEECAAGESNVMDSNYYNTLFGGGINSSITDDPNSVCDIANFNLQKWVLVTIVHDAKTLDIYLDGKLARSCILPESPKVNPTGYTIKVADKNGFNGFISNMQAFDYNLNPEQVWRIYMNGPGGALSLWDYIAGLFNPSSVGTLTYPKYPSA
jgi:hypothetical protein